MKNRMLFVWLACVVVLVSLSVAPARAQQIPPPSGPVVFCGTQAAPDATSYQLVFDNGAPEVLTMDGTVNAACPAGTTHSFSQPASRFTVGQHTVKVLAINAFGSTEGPVYTVTVGIAPGPFTVIAIVPPGGGGE